MYLLYYCTDISALRMTDGLPAERLVHINELYTNSFNIKKS